MSKEEITNRIENLNDELMYEECADLHYNFSRVAELKKELRELEAKLAELKKQIENFETKLA